MATQKQIKANRENATHSTGPTSETGKEAVSQNRTTHGLAGEFEAQNEHELAEYKRLFEQFTDDYNADTSSEIELIGKMVQALIRSDRAVLLQDNCTAFLTFHPDDAPTAKQLELYMRYQASHDRAYQRYAAELRKFQAEKKKAEIGFESQKRQDAKEQRAQAQETRRANNENRRHEQHEIKILNEKARLEHQQLLNRKLAVSEPREGKRPQHQLAA